MGIETEAPDDQPCLFVGIHSNGRFRRADGIAGSHARAGNVAIEFEVHADESPEGELPVDIFVQALGHRGRIKDFRIRRIGEPRDPSPWSGEDVGDANWLMGATTTGVRLPKAAALSRLLGRWTANGELAVRAGERGRIATTGGRTLAAGRYEAVVKYTAAASTMPFLFVMVNSASFVRAAKYIGDSKNGGESRLQFEVHANEEPAGLPVAVDLMAVGGAAGIVRSISVNRLGEVQQSSVWADLLSEYCNWLPLLTGGPAAQWDGALVRGTGESADNVLHGPYLSLPPGSYKATFDLETKNGNQVLGAIDVVADGQVVREIEILPSGRKDAFVVPFDIVSGTGSNIETRVWTKGVGDFRVLGVKIERN